MSAVAPAPFIAPSAAWKGTVGSGFLIAPSDPVRATAKPAIRLLVPPNQYYTDSLLVGVYAGANNGGSLYDNLGLEMVIVHYEGTRTFITEPACQTFDDANGNRVTYFGWWVRLRHDGRNGHGNLYFEAVPKDLSMQRRVIGPYQFSPQSNLHDAEIFIAPTQVELAGSRYKTLSGAMNWCRTNAKHNPRITMVERGAYDLLPMDAVYAGQGYATVRATVPVTITKLADTPPQSQMFRPRYVGMRFKGRNITFDFALSNEIYTTEGANTRQWWLDGINLTNSKGRFHILNHQPRNVYGWLVRGNPWLTECVFTNLWNCAVGASLVRGCTFHRCWGDAVNGAGLTLGSRWNDFDSNEYRAEIPALSASYTGPLATASLSLTGTNNASCRVLTAKSGATSATLTITPRHLISDVVAWINAQAGWSATVVDNRLRANFLTRSGTSGGGAFGDTNAKDVMITLVTMADIHADWAQTYATENIILADNKCTNMFAQMAFFKDGFMRDMLMLNNAFHNKPGDAMLSQLASAHSHVVIAHNSWSRQQLIMRTDFNGPAGSTAEKYNGDAFCMIANNACPAIVWAATIDADLRIEDNHIFTGATAPSGSNGTTVGGTAADNFQNAAGGDFTPKGALLANPKPAVLARRKNAPAVAEVCAAGYRGLD